MSLFGGGTDVEPYSSEYGGITISMAINLRQKITLYTGDDLYEMSGANIIPYRGTHEFNYKILEEFGMDDMHQAKLKSEFDGILEAGLGSSAAAAVALIGAINKAKNLGMSINDIAEKAWDIEVNKIGLFGGRQDQYASSFGGINVFTFAKDGVEVTPLVRGFIEPLIPAMVLLYTGYHRKSAIIQEGLKKLTKDKIYALDNIKRLVGKAIYPVSQGDYVQVGSLLNEAWELKKLSNKVTTPEIDMIYQKGLENGAFGGKLLGSGGGGFILFIINPQDRQEFVKSMGLEEWDFNVCYQGLDVRRLND